jgi:hypothetical protein
MATMHEVDYKVYGDDMQYVEVEGSLLGGLGRLIDGDNR